MLKDFYYKMYSFHCGNQFSLKNLRFKAKDFKEISFLTETTSTHSLSGTIQHDRRSQNMTFFRLQFYLGFVCTIYNMSGRVVSAYKNSSRRRELYI